MSQFSHLHEPTVTVQFTASAKAQNLHVKELFTFFAFSLLCKNVTFRIMTVVGFPHFQPSSVGWIGPCGRLVLHVWNPQSEALESAALKKPTCFHLASPGLGKSEELDYANILSLKHLSDSEASWFEPVGLSVSRDVTFDWV